MFKKDDIIYYEMQEDGIDEIIDEPSGNSYVALRNVRWSPNGPFKLDIRKYYIKGDGTETVGKGVALSDEGADTLAETLIDNNFGDTSKLIASLANREDFDEALEAISVQKAANG